MHAVIQRILRERDLPVFDAHVNIGRYPDVELTGNASWDPQDTIDALIEAMDGIGTSRALVCSFESICYDYVRGNSVLEQMQAGYKGRLFGMATVHPCSASAGEDLQRAVRNGLVGLKLHPRLQRFDPLGSNTQALIEVCDHLRVPVMFHSGAKHRESSPETLVRLARSHPNVTFILCHMGGMNPHLMVEQVRKLENVILETSMSSTGFDSIHRAVKTMGPGRVIYGSDFPCGSMSIEMCRILEARLTDEELRGVLHDNIARVMAEASASRTKSSSSTGACDAVDRRGHR